MAASQLDLSTEYLGLVTEAYAATLRLRREVELDSLLGISKENQRELKLLLLDVQKARRHPRTLAVHAKSHAARIAAEQQWRRMLTTLSDELVARLDVTGAFHAASLGWITPPHDAEPEDGVFCTDAVRKDAVAPPATRRLSKVRPSDEAAIEAWGGDRATAGRLALRKAELGADVRVLRDATGAPLAVVALSRDTSGALTVDLLAASPGHGTGMMQEVAKIAKREGLGIALNSVPQATGFYSKLGMQAGAKGAFSFSPAQAAAFAQAGGYIAPPGSKKPQGMTPAENLALQSIATNILQGGMADVSGRLASGVNFDSWHSGGMQRYIGMTIDSSTQAGQLALEHLGYHDTFEWAHPQQMARDVFSVRGSKVIQQMYGDHIDTLTKIITDATDPRNPKTLDQVRESIRTEWPGLQRYQVDRIARTETAAVWTTTAANTYAANGIDSFESIIATGPSIGIDSEDPCDECVDAAADVHSIDDDLPPWHPNCRCEAVPSLEGEDGEPWLPPDEPWTGEDVPVSEEPLSTPDNLTPAPYPGDPMGGYPSTPAQDQAASDFATAALPELQANDAFAFTHTAAPARTARYHSATPGNEQIVRGQVTHEDLRRYYLKHLNDVTGPGAAEPGKMFLNGWRDPGTGWTYLDTSTSFADQQAAIQFGRDHMQQAIFDSKTGESLTLHPTEPPTVEPFRVPGTADDVVPMAANTQQADGRLAALGLPPETVDTIKRLGLDGWPPKKGTLAEQMFPGKDIEDTLQLYRTGPDAHWEIQPGKFNEDGTPKREWVGGQWTPERVQEHQKWEAAVFEGKVKATGTPQALFTSGGGASGKGGSEFFFDGQWRTVKELQGRDDIVVIDPDGIKKMTDEFKALQDGGDIYAASSVHEESSELSKLFMKRALAEGYNVIFDSTASGGAKFIGKLQEAKDAGYEVQVTMTSIPTDKAVIRSIARAEKKGGDSEGRYVNTRALMDAHEGASTTLPLWQRSDLVDRWRVYDNAGAKPVVVAEGGGGATAVIHDTQTFDQILEKGGIDRSPTPFTADTFQSYLDSQPVGTRFTLPESSATGAVHGTWEQEDLSGMRFWRAVDGRQAGEFQSSGYFGTTYQRPVLDALGPPPVDVAATLTPADAEGRVEMPDKTDRFRDEFRNIGLSPAGDHFSQQLVQTFADWPYLNPKTARELRTWLKTEQKGSGLFTLKGLKERGVDDPRGMRREVNRVLDAIDKRLPEGKQNPKYGEDHPEATSAAYITGGHANSPEQLMGEFKRLGVEENELARIDPSIIYVGRDPYYMSTNQGVWAYPYKGTAVVVETPMSKDALSYSWEQAKEYQVKINAMLDRIPETTNRDNFKSLFVGQRGSPSDERIAAENGLKDFEAAAQATSQTGQMWLWHGSTNLERQGIIDHEFGHIIGNRNGALAPDKWQLARADDMPVSNEWIGLLSGKEQEVTPGKFGVTAYGSTNDVEDWAESVRLYLQDRRDGELGLGFKWKPDQVPWPPGSHEVGLSHPHISDFLGEKVPGVRFADIFPNRAKLLDRWLFTDLPVNAPSASEALATRLKGTIKTLETQLRIAGDDAGRKLFQDLLDERRAELDALNKGEPSPAIDAYAVAVEPKPYMEAVPVGGVLDVPATPATIDTAGKWKKLDDGQWQAVGRGGEKRSSDFLDVSFAIGMTLLLPGPQLGRGLVADRAAWVVFLHQLHAYLPRHPLPPPSGQPTTSQEENKKTGPPPSLYDQTVAKLRRKAGR